jgi:uroporphyrin-III C-methyltransferase
MDEPTSPVVAVPDEPTRRSGGALKGILILIVLAAVAAAAWWWWTTRDTHTAASAPIATPVDSQIESLMHSMTQLRSATDTLRARLDDGEKVDKSVREQLLSLSERTRLLEDAIGNLANKRLSGHDSLALDEAELLLTLGGERFELFHDPAGAIAAYRAADTAFSEVEDATFSTVRQSINAEISALSGLQAADPTLLVNQLTQLRTRISSLEAKRGLPEVAPDDSRLMRVLGALVQVHHDDASSAMPVTDIYLARQLAILDLRDAQAAALTRDDANFKVAIATARGQVASAFDANSPDVAAVLAQFDPLLKAQLAPAAPSILGISLKELRNRRASHALRASSGTAIPPDVLKNDVLKNEGVKP